MQISYRKNGRVKTLKSPPYTPDFELKSIVVFDGFVWDIVPISDILIFTDKLPFTEEKTKCLL